jgi:hypothetical protein
MLVPLTLDFHLTTLQGVEDAAIVASMVLCGVDGSLKII